MKAKELLYAIGIKPAPREYSFDIATIDLPKYGPIEYAQWKHPKMGPLGLTDQHVDALKAYVNEGDVVIDIGAHAGDTTIPMALAVGRTGTVFALEPNLYAYKILLANVGLNQSRARILPMMVAAADQDGETEFEYSDPGFCNGGNHEGIQARKHAHFFKLAVKTIHLGNYLRTQYPELADRITFLKIDTEGYDLYVAKALEDVITQNLPHVRTEIYRHTSREYRIEYRDFWRGLGYTVHKLKSERDYLGDEITDEVLFQDATFDLFAIPPSK